MLTLKLKHAFRRTYVWALLITALIVVISFVIDLHTEQLQDETTQRMDLTLDVRSHMHNIAFLTNRLVLIDDVTERDVLRQEIAQEMDIMSSNYNQLLEEADSQKLLDIHQKAPYELSQKVSAFLKSARELGTIDLVTVNTPAYQQIITLRDVLMDGFTILVEQYRFDNQTLIEQHQRTELVLFLLLLLALALEALFIFRPMERRILTTQGELQTEVERSRSVVNALADSETRYRQMFENHPAVKILVNPQDGRIIEANEAASKFYGYSLAQLKTMTVFQLNVQPTSFLIAARDQLLSMPNAIFQGEHRLASGETRYVEVSAGPLFINNRQVIYAIVQDVTERKRVEDALRENEIRFRTLFEQTNDGIYIIDLNGKLLAMNQSALNMLGYAKDEIDQYPISQLSAENTDSLRTLERVRDGERVPLYERYFRKKTGELVPVEINAELVRTADGTPLHIQTIVRDISHRKQAEQALRESEKLYRVLVQNMPATSVLMFDTSQHYTLVEGPFLKRLGKRWETALGKTPREVLTEESADAVIPMNERALKGERFSYERTTETYAYQSYVMPLLDDNGMIKGGMVLLHDITELKHTEQALRANEQQLRLITDSVQDIITQTNVDNEIIYASPSYLTILGYDPASLLGKSGASFVHPSDRDHYSRTLEAAVHTPERLIVIEGRLRHQQGQYLWTETVGKLLINDKGQYIGAVYVTRDITERKRLEQALVEQETLRTALEKEQELSILKTRMMEVLAHEFRTPLAVIQVTLGTLSDYFDRITPEQRASRYNTITDRIHRITEMLDELDIIVRGGFSIDNLQRTAIDFTVMCRKIAADLEKEYGLSGKYVLELTAPAIIHADSVVLANAVKNILSNAARFSSPADTVKVELIARDHGFELCVADKGIGIPFDDQARLFQAFFRASNVGAIGGLGLGLTIARAAVVAHQGTINVESEVGRSTTVRMWLPIDSVRYAGG